MAGLLVTPLHRLIAEVEELKSREKAVLWVLSYPWGRLIDAILIQGFNDDTMQSAKRLTVR